MGRSFRTLCVFALASLTLTACKPVRPEIRWGEILQEQHIARQRLFAIEPIRVAQSCHGDGPPQFGEALSVTVRVNRLGQPRILAIDLGYGRPHIRKECLSLASAAVSQWRYRPFAPGGEPIELTIAEAIPVYPSERWREQRVPFPDIDDISAVRVVLERSGCYGACPAYRIELRGDGTSTFTGYAFVATVGEHQGVVDIGEFENLVRQFEEADFFSLLDSYAAEVVDMPAYRTTLIIGSQRASVVDYEGPSVGMPLVVSQLEDEIERVGRAEQWTERRSQRSAQ